MNTLQKFLEIQLNKKAFKVNFKFARFIFFHKNKLIKWYHMVQLGGKGLIIKMAEQGT